MARRTSLRDELEELKAELAALRAAKAPAGEAEAGAAAEAEPKSVLEQQLGELNRLVQDMLDDAEAAVAAHPAATVAGALALGIVIGRLTHR